MTAPDVNADVRARFRALLWWGAFFAVVVGLVWWATPS